MLRQIQHRPPTQRSVVAALGVAIVLILVAIIFIIAAGGMQQRNKDNEHSEPTWYGGYSKNAKTPNALTTIAIILAVGVVCAAIAVFAIRPRRAYGPQIDLLSKQIIY